MHTRRDAFSYTGGLFAFMQAVFLWIAHPVLIVAIGFLLAFFMPTLVFIGFAIMFVVAVKQVFQRPPPQPHRCTARCADYNT